MKISRDKINHISSLIVKDFSRRDELDYKVDLNDLRLDITRTMTDILLLDDKADKEARRVMFAEHTEDSIAPILPIEMGLTVYGNEFLSIGDFVTINFLPKQYKDRSFFQIVGIEHKITPEGWDTTYNLLFRVMPKAKKDVLKDPKKISDNIASTVALSTFLSFFTLIVVVFISLKYFG